MFTDWQQALEAEGLPLNPTSTEQEAAARVTARHAHSEQDLVLLLGAIGLPGDDTTLATLLPLLPRCEGNTDMPQTQPTPEPSPTAFEAMALSMYYADASAADITAATGLSEDEVTTLVNAQEAKIQATLAADEQSHTTPTPTSEKTETAGADDPVEQLLAWAEAHPAAGIRNKAARVRSDLAELTARRAADDAQREAEERVARLKAELEQAQEQLRAVKAGPRPAGAAPASAPTPIRAGLGSGRTPRDLAAIRAWARAAGYQVAGKGMVPKAVLAAYDAAQQAPARRAG